MVDGFSSKGDGFVQIKQDSSKVYKETITNSLKFGSSNRQSFI